MGLIRKSGTLRVALVVMAVLAALSLTTCGGGKHTTNPPSVGSGGFQAAEGVGSLEAAPPTTTSPQSIEDALMERLTAALAEALEAREGKVAAAAPSGEGNLIVDLNCYAGGVGGNRLVWHYRNLGDYDQNGAVGIADITPLAMHFGETIAEDPLVEVIDGDLDGAAGLGDVQAIAENYGCTVAGYIVESAIEEHGEYAEMGSVEFASATGGDVGWKDLVFALPTGDALWYRVVPVDAAGARGIESLPVRFHSPSAAPRVTAVSPRIIEPGTAVRFTATVEGEAPFEYHWDFGDAGIPSSSTDAEPLVVLLELGRHVCWVQVNNSHGQHVYFFAVLVTPTVYPPFIERVWPTSAVAYTQMQFFAQVSGTGPFEWHWNFGGGAEPNESDEPWPSVRVGSEGNYQCELTVSNSAGPDSFSFTLDVSPGQIGDWRMFRHDAQHTGRSPYVGAQTAALKWRYDTGMEVSSSPAIGADGTIYVGGEAPNDDALCAVNPDGTLKWQYETRWAVGSNPAIAADGTVYVGGRYDGLLHAINPDGTLKWSYETGRVYSSPAIGADRTIYVGGSRWLYALNPDGTLRWSYETGSVSSSPAIGPDGTIYVGVGTWLYALNPDGTLKWRYETDAAIYSSPAIGADGAVYVGISDWRICAVNADGTLKWEYETGYSVTSSPAIGIDGAVYVGDWGPYLNALNPDGTLRWRFKAGYVSSSPAIGADGTVYVGSGNGYFYAVNSDGTLKWNYETGDCVRSSPAIGADGTVYVGSDDGYLYAFHDESPPVIISVSPTVRMAGKNATFTAEMWGASPFSYYWSFGGGATPNTSNEPSPTVTMLEPGEYSASLTVINSYGEDTYPFALTSVGPTPPGDWYMFGRDATHSRRSPYVGAQTATLAWRLEIGVNAYSNPAIAADGTVYVGSGKDLGAIYPDGRLKWRYETRRSYSPAIGADGTIYVGSGDYYLYAINPDGTLKWRYDYDTGWYVRFSPAIGADGTIYVGSSDLGYPYHCSLLAVNPDGTLKWRYETDGSVYSSPAIGADGTIYVGTYCNYFYAIYAINPNGTFKWRYETDAALDSSPVIGADGTIYVGSGTGLFAVKPDGTLNWYYPSVCVASSSPAIGADGTIYIGGILDYSYLYAIKPDGTLKWRYETGAIWSDPAIGADGTIYVGSYDHYLYAINPDGTLKWRYETGHVVDSSPAIGADGTIYVGSSDHYVYAVNPDGALKWRYETGGDVDSSPAIGEDGTVYVGSRDGYLYAFRD